MLKCEHTLIKYRNKQQAQHLPELLNSKVSLHRKVTADCLLQKKEERPKCTDYP